MSYAHYYHPTIDYTQLKGAELWQLCISEVYHKGMKQGSFMDLREPFLPKSLIILKC